MEQKEAGGGKWHGPLRKPLALSEDTQEDELGDPAQPLLPQKCLWELPLLQSFTYQLSYDSPPCARLRVKC